MTYPPQPEQPAWQQPPNPQYQPGPPKKKASKTAKIVFSIAGALIILVVIAGIVGGGGSTSPSTSTSPTQAAPLTSSDLGSPAGQVAAATTITTTANDDTVVYTITGKSSTDITYISPDLQESQITDRTALPWSKTFTVPAGTAGLGMSLDAQNAEGGTISCSISVNGKVVVSNSSSGQYALVMCTATNP